MAVKDPNADEREEMEYYYSQHPGKKPSAYDKLVMAGKAAANAAYDAGAHATAVGREIGQNPHVQQMARQDGFTAPVQAVPRHSTSRQEYPGAPVTDNSVMHPGNRLVVMKCNDATGKCRTIATGISMEKSKEPRQARQRPWQRGGLGGDDPGF